MICYYGKHYVSLFVRRTQDPTSRSYGEWLLFDDATIRVLGSWRDVKKHCVAARYQPTVVWFEQVPTGEAPWWADDDDDNDDDDDGGIGAFFNNVGAQVGAFLSDSITDLGKPVMRPATAQPVERATSATNHTGSMATATRQPAGNARELPQRPLPRHVPAQPRPRPPPPYSPRAAASEYRSRNPAHRSVATTTNRTTTATSGGGNNWFFASQRTDAANAAAPQHRPAQVPYRSARRASASAAAAEAASGMVPTGSYNDPVSRATMGSRASMSAGRRGNDGECDDDEAMSMRLGRADLGLAESATSALWSHTYPNSAKF